MKHIACLLLTLGIMFGQVPTAQVTGIISDPSGAAVPASGVKLRNEGTGIEYIAVINAEGRYSAVSIPPGSYTIDVSAQGFKTKAVTGIVLEVGQTARVDVVLDLGQVSEHVTVKGDSPLLQAEGATVGTVVTQKQLMELPLNGRSFVELAILTPGASDGFSNSYQKTYFGKRSENYVIQANGIRSEFTSTTIDGINTQTIDRHWTSVLYPSVDMIQEFKSETSNYSSQFTGGGGVALNVVTKAGSNEYHGSMFEFFQNRSLNARNFFLPASQKNPDEKYHQFGATVGGPIIRNRTFFFGSYQGLRIKNSFVNQTRVPTEKERRGDFSDSLLLGQLVLDPDTTVVNTSVPIGYSRMPFGGNVIPANRINGFSKQITDLGFPLPTNLEDRSFNFKQFGANPDSSNQWSIRVDHNQSDRNMFFGRWTQEPRRRFTVGLQADRGTQRRSNGYTGASGWNHIFSPSLLSEFRVGYSRFIEQLSGDLKSLTIIGPGGQIALPGTENIPENQRQGLTSFAISGLADPTYGTAPRFRVENMYQINDKLTWTRGKHSMNFGGSIRRNEDFSPLQTTLLSNWQFLGGFTQFPLGSNPKQSYDTGYGDFLLGLASALSPVQQLIPKRYAYFYQYQADFFVDDQIRLTRNLSVSLGLRYTYTQSPREKENWVSFFDYGTGELVYPSAVRDRLAPFAQYIPYRYRTDGPSQLFNMPWANFQPRVSIAWSPSGSKTVIRTGYALYDATPSVANVLPMAQVPPFIVSGQRGTSNIFSKDAFNLSRPAVSPDLKVAFADPSLQLGEYNFKTPTVQMWNFQVQRALTSSMDATIGYVGNKTDHLNKLVRPNSPPPGPGVLGPRRPYPGFSRMISVNWLGITNYNGLQANITKRFSQGMSFTVSYSFSKALGNVDELIALGVSGYLETPSLLNLDYGPLSYDFTNIFRSSLIYELPIGHGRTFGGSLNPFVNGVVGGWQLSGIATMQTGQAYTVGGGGDLNNERGSRPDRICDGNLPMSQRTINLDYDVSCFVNHPPFKDGTAGVNVLRQRPLRNINFSISKSFHLPIRELTQLQFRGEMFNAINTPFFAIPGHGCCGAAGTGRITSTERDARVVQMGLKLLF